MKVLLALIALLFIATFTTSAMGSKKANVVTIPNNMISTVVYDINGDDPDDEIEKEISPSDLPQSIKDDIMVRYPGAELLEADEITKEDGNITYDVEIKNNGVITEVMYDAAGNFLGIESDDGDSNEKDDDWYSKVN